MSLTKMINRDEERIRTANDDYNKGIKSLKPIQFRFQSSYDVLNQSHIIRIHDIKFPITIQLHTSAGT